MPKITCFANYNKVIPNKCGVLFVPANGGENCDHILKIRLLYRYGVKNKAAISLPINLHGK